MASVYANENYVCNILGFCSIEIPQKKKPKNVLPDETAYNYDDHNSNYDQDNQQCTYCCRYDDHSIDTAITCVWETCMCYLT